MLHVSVTLLCKFLRQWFATKVVKKGKLHVSESLKTIIHVLQTATFAQNLGNTMYISNKKNNVNTFNLWTSYFPNFKFVHDSPIQTEAKYKVATLVAKKHNNKLNLYSAISICPMALYRMVNRTPDELHELQ